MTAKMENHATLPFPRVVTMSAARSGPKEEPAFPPTWKIDWARPRLSPAAMCATREPSGWNTDEPRPTDATDTRIIGKLEATESKRRPINVNPMPTAREYGFGFRSAYAPTSG